MLQQFVKTLFAYTDALPHLNGCYIIFYQNSTEFEAISVKRGPIIMSHNNSLFYQNPFRENFEYSNRQFHGQQFNYQVRLQIKYLYRTYWIFTCLKYNEYNYNSNPIQFFLNAK